LNSILITGGCGFVGVNLVRALVDVIPDITVVDNLSTGHSEDVADLDIDFVQADIRDKECMRKAVEGKDAVIHLAADTRVMDSIEDPETNFDVNAAGTLNLLKQADAAGVSRFITASTGGAIIGDCEPPVHEDMVPRPLSPYGASKLAAEGYCSAFAGSYNMNTVALRFANVYGPYSYHKGSVIAKFFKNMLHDEPLTVYGDGTQTRDFVYTGDLCRAIQSVLFADLNGHNVFNLGSGKEITILELIEHMKIVTGKQDYPVAFEPPRQGEVYRNYTCIDKAKRTLDYEPSMNLRDGLQNTWAWFQSET